MKILVEDKDLALLIEQKKDFIGNKYSGGMETLFSGVSFSVSAWAAQYKNFLGVPGTAIKTMFIILGAVLALRGLMKMVNSILPRNKYSKDKMFNDILDLNKIEHPHSLVAIQDTFNSYPKRFLRLRA